MLVNGAVGTVMAIKAHNISVQFEYTYDVERDKSKFMIMNVQFPLILAFAITVHKCQGLSLDCAVMGLSNEVFCPGMALSRVKCLDNLYLTAFTKEASKVSTKCLEEINRLRKSYRPDLPQYSLPRVETNTATKKWALAGVLQSDVPPF